MSTFESIKTSRPCPLSNSKDAFLVASKDRHGGKLRNVISRESGLIFVDPVPFKNTEEFYKKEYRQAYKGVEQPKAKHVYRAGQNALKRHQRISSLIPINGPVLDAGSSSGEFVYLLKSQKIVAEGIEANHGYADFSKRQLGLDVSIQAFSEFSSNRSFNLITMFHVLEHLENPTIDLNHLCSFLNPKGHLIIEVPNILYPDMAFRNKWHSGHLFSYCEHTLRNLAEKLGLAVIYCEAIEDGGNLFGVFQKVSQAIPVEQNGQLSIEKKVELLHIQGFKYYFQFRNLLKVFKKIGRFFIEKKKTRGKNAKEILKKLYESPSP